MKYIVNLSRAVMFDYVEPQDISKHQGKNCDTYNSNSAALAIERLSITVYGVDYGFRVQGTEAAFVVQAVSEDIADFLLSSQCAFTASGAYQEELLRIFDTEKLAVDFGYSKYKEIKQDVLNDYRQRVQGNNPKDDAADIKPISETKEVDFNDRVGNNIIDMRQVENKPLVSGVNPYFPKSLIGLVA